VTRLPRGFFERPALEVAPDLIGRDLVRRFPAGGRARVRIVETEAYLPDDPASHAFRGRTDRNAAMFGPGGHAYVYFVYGMHHCLNVVVGRDGEGTAVLLRGAEPIAGLEAMRGFRGGVADRLLCTGPARLAQALAVDRGHDGVDLVRGGDLWFEPGSPTPAARIARGPRVGVRAAADVPWRFWEVGSPGVSRIGPGVSPPDPGRRRAGSRG
jgi:DNA-3-methyladenine glycosylase